MLLAPTFAFPNWGTTERWLHLRSAMAQLHDLVPGVVGRLYQ